MIYNKPMKYKEICELMGEEPIKNIGSKKNQQIRKWRQFYEIEKDGMYFTIKRKYKDNELDLIEHEGKYTSYIKDTLIKYLMSLGVYETVLSYYDIYEITQMVNETYHKAKNNMYRNTKYVEIDKFKTTQNPMERQYIESMLNVFFLRSGRILKQNINNALDIMQKESLIIYDKTFLLYKNPIQHVNDSGEVWYENQPRHICTEKEKSIMIDFKNESLKIVGLRTLQDLVFCSWETKEVYNNNMLCLVQDNFGYDYYGDGVHLILGEKALARELKYLSTKINDNVQNQLSNNLKKDINKYLLCQMNTEYIRV